MNTQKNQQPKIFDFTIHASYHSVHLALIKIIFDFCYMFGYVRILVLLWSDDLEVNISHYSVNNMVLYVVLSLLFVLLELSEDFKFRYFKVGSVVLFSSLCCKMIPLADCRWIERFVEGMWRDWCRNFHRANYFLPKLDQAVDFKPTFLWDRTASASKK